MRWTCFVAKDHDLTFEKIFYHHHLAEKMYTCRYVSKEVRTQLLYKKKSIIINLVFSVDNHILPRNSIPHRLWCGRHSSYTRPLGLSTTHLFSLFFLLRFAPIIPAVKRGSSLSSLISLPSKSWALIM